MEGQEMTQIKSLDELKDLDKVLFNGVLQEKDGDGDWNDTYGNELISYKDHVVYSSEMLDVKCWHYYEEPKQEIKEPQFGVAYQSESDPTCRATLQWRQKFRGDGEVSYGIMGIHFTLEAFWQEWELAEIPQDLEDSE